MNPLRLLRIYRAGSRVGDLLQEASVSKSLWKSKTFWFNLLSAASTLAGVIPLDPQTATLVIAGINVGLRLITTGPVTVLTDAAEQ